MKLNLSRIGFTTVLSASMFLSTQGMAEGFLNQVSSGVSSAYNGYVNSVIDNRVANDLRAEPTPEEVRKNLVLKDQPHTAGHLYSDVAADYIKRVLGSDNNAITRNLAYYPGSDSVADRLTSASFKKQLRQALNPKGSFKYLKTVVMAPNTGSAKEERITTAIYTGDGKEQRKIGEVKMRRYLRQHVDGYKVTTDPEYELEDITLE